MKKIIFLLVCLLMLVANVNAYDAIIDGMYFNLNEETLTATITHKGGQYGYSDGLNSYLGSEVIVPAPIVSMLFGIVISVKTGESKNASTPIDLTLSGSTTLVKF